MKFLLITPPLTQLNTPYPATATLKGYLEGKGHHVAQADLGIEMVNKIYTHSFLEKVFKHKPKNKEQQRIYEQREQYIACVETVVRFLQGLDNTLAPRISNRSLLPEGGRFDNMADLEWAFGTSGTEDKARYMATLFMEDIADYIRENVDEHFDLIRYAEQIANYAPTFDKFEEALHAPLTEVDNVMLDLLSGYIEKEQPEIVGFSIPFPGCLYGGLRCAQWVRNNCPKTTVIFGGGFANTEWRQLSDDRIFKYTHYITLDDGELPLERITKLLEGKIGTEKLVQTYFMKEGKLHFQASKEVLGCAELGVPDFRGLPLDKYISLAEMTNPMHRLWSNGRWNKMMMAHGCYWHRCAFCDTTLDYIGRYDAPTATMVVDRMEKISQQSGITGFHFVDEALPPQLLKEVSEEILKRHLVFTWWGNIRFEKAYTEELCYLMSDAGCVAVSGGLELASDRLLKLIDKGVTINQTVQACRHFKQAGIMVHTYLMYGFPTQTLQETVNALDVVRQMFDEGIVQSAFWHRYAMTCHSRSGHHPEQFGATRTITKPNPFCNNEIDWDSDFPYDIEAVGEALRFATFNYMNEIGLDMPLQDWFSIKIPKPKTKPI